MAIELLNAQKVWAKIKAGMGGGKLFHSPPAPKSYRYVAGREPLAEQAQQVSAAAPKGSVFGGKTFSGRR